MNTYHTFDFFIIRVPALSINAIREEMLEENVSNHKVQEAIYLASPDLFSKLESYCLNKIVDPQKKQKIKLALYRYIIRMSTRCTPFGLFAGCTIGYISNNNQSNIRIKKIYRRTRLNMLVLEKISSIILRINDINKNIKYYPNTSLYKKGNKYRYIEYKLLKSTIFPQILSIDSSSYLNAIIKIAKNGATIEELLLLLKKLGFEKEYALIYIKEIIQSQILTSELAPSTTGDDYFCKIIKTTNKLNDNSKIKKQLEEVSHLLYTIDKIKQDNIRSYKRIVDILKEIRIPFEEKYLFQVDTLISTDEATLGKDIIKKLQEALVFLNKITPYMQNETLEQFKKKFYQRYENKEVPLIEVLDRDMGIGYPIKINRQENSALLDNFYFPNKEERYYYTMHNNQFLSILLNKTIEAYKDKKIEITFKDNDIDNLECNWEDLPLTFYSIFKILDNNNISLLGFYGSCGANLFARYGYLDKQINELIKTITKKEQELMPNVILAEIAHISDLGRCNILSRTHIRDYEILYLSNSDLTQEKIIHASELYLSIRDGKLILRSKKLNKEILPRLTNSHNYDISNIPLYRFLCDMQNQDNRNSLSFKWYYLENELKFLPRIKYKNIILSPAIWKIEVREIKKIFDIENDDELLLKVNIWRKQHNIPDKTVLSDGDKELLTCWDNTLSIRSLFQIIKGRSVICLKEFLFSMNKEVVIDNVGNPYVNECIVAFYKVKK